MQQNLNNQTRTIKPIQTPQLNIQSKMRSLIIQVAVCAFIFDFQWSSIAAENISFELYAPKEDSVRYPHNKFDPQYPTRIFIQDLDEDALSDASLQFRKHYDNLGYYNKIVVSYPKGPADLLNYPPIISIYIHNMMREDRPLQLNSTIVIGNGAGAYLAGIVGRKIRHHHNKTFQAIFALDPPPTAYVYLEHLARLRLDDADKVVVFHNNASHTNFTQKRLGALDIYLETNCSISNCSKNTAFGAFMKLIQYNLESLPTETPEECPQVSLVEGPSELEFLNLCGAYRMFNSKPLLIKALDELAPHLIVINRHWGDFCIFKQGFNVRVIKL